METEDDDGLRTPSVKESRRVLDTKTSTFFSSVVSSTRYRDLEIPLDYQYLSLTAIADLQSIPEPRPMGKRRILLDGRDLFFTRALRLNNNNLTELSGLQDFICTNVLNPEVLSWIDLSFNCLTTIDPMFCNYPSLRILYLHGNQISSLSEVDKLRGIAALRKLSLHGNPMENEKNYKMYVLATMPQIHNFDMTTLTRGDRVTAATWKANLPMKVKKGQKTAA